MILNPHRKFYYLQMMCLPFCIQIRNGFETQAFSRKGSILFVH